MSVAVIKKNYSLKEHTSWKIGGAADWAVFPSNKDELVGACAWAKNNKLPITVLSGGTNVLISDKGVAGLVILLQNLNKIDSNTYVNGVLEIVAQAGVPKADILKIFIKHRLSPAVFLAGLPGDVGGGVVMNAGVSHEISPKEFQDIVSWVEVIDLQESEFKVRRLYKQDLQWQYRRSLGWQPGIIYRVGLSWSLPSDENVLKVLQESNRRRMSTQPLSEPSCGSVFKNPPGNKSGRLIEECGLKGFSIGGAQVSEKHANFIVNRGDATSDDVEALREHVQKTVKAQTGILLETEYVFMGRQ